MCALEREVGWQLGHTVGRGQDPSLQEDNGRNDDPDDYDDDTNLLPTSAPPHLYNSFLLDPCW